MLVLAEKPTAYFDVDETLILWNPPGVAGVEPQIICDRPFWPHYNHIERLKDHAKIGHNVVVWSAGGAEHAARVVRALGLAKYVHVVAPKPSWAYDDDRPEYILNKVKYVSYHTEGPHVPLSEVSES